MASPGQSTSLANAHPDQPAASTSGQNGSADGMDAHMHVFELDRSVNLQPPMTHTRTTTDMDDADASAPTTPGAPPERTERNGASGGFILRIPATAMSTPGRDRGDSPASGSVASTGKRKRRSDPPNSIAATRPRRGRNSSPNGTGASSRDGSTAPSSRATPAPSVPPPGGALSIFAAPDTNDVAAEVQSIVGTGRKLRERATPVDDSAARARPTRGGETHVRAGVSASGRGRRVGSRVQSTTKQGTPRPTSAAAKGKGKQEATPDFVNQDFCSACRGIGRFLCCDGCPRSFHFMCLDPPLRIDELPEEETWYCNKCRADRAEKGVEQVQKNKDKPVTTVFKQLIHKIENENPQQFRLPQEIRQYFVGVSAGPLGEYVDTETARTKYDRKGFQEERDPIRLRDAKSRPIACYKCGGSSIPLRSPASDPEASWRPIVSCDYCALHWHLDCLSPPLATMPNAARKWMCPNHADQVMPRRRTVRNGLDTVDVESAGTPNNGNIAIVDNEEPRPPIPTEDMVINNRKYRVPERVIQLDFWTKIGRGGPKPEGRETKCAKVAEDLVQKASKEDLDAASLMLSLFGGPSQQRGPNDPVPEGHTNGEHKAEEKQTTPVPNGTSSPRPPNSGGSGGSGGPRRITLRLNAPAWASPQEEHS